MCWRELAAVARCDEVVQHDRIGRERADAVVAHGCAERVGEGRAPVGGERHHLVLVGRAAKAEVVRHLLVQEAERVWEGLRGERHERAVAPVGRQVRGALAPAVDHEDGAGIPPRREAARRGVGDVVGDEAHCLGVEPGQRRRQEARRPLRVQRAQPLPAVGRHVVAARRERRVVGIGDGVEVARLRADVGEAPAGRFGRQLPGRERHGRLPVLAPAEALFLGRGSDRCRRPPARRRDRGRRR